MDPRYAGSGWPGNAAVYVHYTPGPNGGPPPPGGQPVGGGWYHMSNMQNMPPPPPVYDANRPPMYDETGAAPTGSKIDPNQQQGTDYAPPSGPPPGR